MFLSANLHAKEDLAREESVSACRSLALQCSDASALEGLLQHLFDVFHGSEGKLTVATHKMSVLQVSCPACFPLFTEDSSMLYWHYCCLFIILMADILHRIMQASQLQNRL